MITEKNKKFLARFDHHLDDEHIDRLVNDKVTKVRSYISTNPNLKYHQIDKLVNDNSGMVRCKIAEHPGLGYHHIDKLLDDNDYFVILATRGNQHYQDHHDHHKRQHEEQK